MFVLIIFIIGSACVIIATIIATVLVPKKDEQIKNINEKIDHLEARRERGILFSLNYRQNEIKKRINHHELNNLILHNADENAKSELKNLILIQYTELIKNWTVLWAFSEGNSTLDTVNAEIEEIKQGGGDFHVIQPKLQKLLYESQENANNNLSKIQKERDELKEKKASLTKNRRKINSIFIWFQIGGLLLIGISTFVEKVRIE